MNKFVLVLLSAFAVNANAETISMDLSAMKIEQSQATKQRNMSFSKISIKGFENTKIVGAPELPVKSRLLSGKPADIQIRIQTKKTVVLDKVRPFPVQEQDCRCETKTVKKFRMDDKLYAETTAPYTLTYLGAFRGSPITRLDIHLGSYDAATGNTVLRTEVEVSQNVSDYSFERAEYNDYLIIAPPNMVEGTTAFVDWKRSHGNNVSVETYASPNNSLAALSALIRKYYTEKNVDFVILVGDESMIPMYLVSTSGSSSTPTDLTHFTMDGAGDKVPDMFYSRIAAPNAAQVAEQLNKSIEFEKKTYENLSGLKNVIGIASNEGSYPSDDQYVRSISERFTSVLGMTSTHFHQNDSANSNPAGLNKAFTEGALWLTYLGHGSGTSWPSMNRSYSVSDIFGMNNKASVKPVIIDVACMNGKISANYLGASFMKTVNLTTTNPFGGAAYYGGTVNISWHPPAIMARGIVYEHLAKKYRYLGEALLAGQLYLAGNWNSTSEVVDNMEWYHLQGDPGMPIEF